jgi:hypothetical protein
VAPHAARRAAALAFLIAAALSIAPVPAGAATEEFSTFDVVRMEADDESLLDHFLTRAPHAWRDEWERAPQALRTSQGCLTSGQWFIDTYLKVNSSLGRVARLGIDLRQSESDASSYDYLDFTFQFPTRFGTPGLMFRPLYDKSRQDFAATWELGSDTAAIQLQLVFTMEDMFNNLWSFRQTRVGERSEPYTRHPYEPAMRFVLRQPTWRIEAAGRYLTPSVKRVVEPNGTIDRVSTLWGAQAFGLIELQALGCHWEARGTNQQAASNDLSMASFVGRNHHFRRRWSTEGAVARTFGRALTAEARGIYQERDQALGAPLGPATFTGVDRMFGVETRYAIQRSLTARVGALYDRISIDRDLTEPFSYGSRSESRAYVGLIARFGRVSLSAVEGIELDPEPYEVWWVHDKAFLHLQATF